MDKIFLDNSATTKPFPEVLEAMDQIQRDYWGNPSSAHSFGREAKNRLEEAREKVAAFVGVKPEEIIFTSGGSESDNLAIRGIVSQYYSVIPGLTRNLKDPGSPVRQAQGMSEIECKLSVRDDNGGAVSKPHVITSAIEHHAVLHTVQELEKQGLIEATYLNPDANGMIKVEDVENSIKDNTLLVTIMYVNNEVGTVQPINEIAEAISFANRQSPIANRPTRIIFHTDAVQAAEFMNISPEYLKVDLMSLSAHKIHGPRGVGVLYVREGVKLKPEITGGGQERKLRAGTENVAGIAGMQAAMEKIQAGRIEKDSTLGLAKLRDKLETELKARIPDVIINGLGAERAPHITNISFLNAEGEAIILNLDFLGIAVSSGSACTSASLAPSHVLSAMGIPDEQAHGSIRFSLSRETTEEEIDRVIEVLPGIIEKLRAMSPFTH